MSSELIDATASMDWRDRYGRLETRSLGGGSMVAVFRITHKDDSYTVVREANKFGEDTLGEEYDTLQKLAGIPGFSQVIGYHVGGSDRREWIEVTYLDGRKMREDIASRATPSLRLLILGSYTQSIRSAWPKGILISDHQFPNCLLDIKGDEVTVNFPDMNVMKKLEPPDEKRVTGYRKIQTATDSILVNIKELRFPFTEEKTHQVVLACEALVDYGVKYNEWYSGLYQSNAQRGVTATSGKANKDYYNIKLEYAKRQLSSALDLKDPTEDEVKTLIHDGRLSQEEKLVAEALGILLNPQEFKAYQEKSSVRLRQEVVARIHTALGGLTYSDNTINWYKETLGHFRSKLVDKATEVFGGTIKSLRDAGFYLEENQYAVSQFANLRSDTAFLVSLIDNWEMMDRREQLAAKADVSRIIKACSDLKDKTDRLSQEYNQAFALERRKIILEDLRFFFKKIVLPLLHIYEDNNGELDLTGSTEDFSEGPINQWFKEVYPKIKQENTLPEKFLESFMALVSNRILDSHIVAI